MTANTMKAGTNERYGASRKTGRSAWSGMRSSLKKTLMPSARLCRIPHGPGPVRADAVLHVADDLALEPDHQHGGHEQEHERDHDLEQHDQHDGEVDRAGEQRIGGEHHDRGVHTDVGDGHRGVDEHRPAKGRHG